MKKAHRKSKPSRFNYDVILGLMTLLMIVAGVTFYGMIGYNFIKNIYHEYFPKDEYSQQAIPEPTPAQLVGWAMEMPGAIVLSPHKDLVSMNMVPKDWNHMFTAGPAIAIPTKHKWCIWSLSEFAENQGQRSGNVSKIIENTFEITGSNLGYFQSYQDIMRCLHESNVIDPIKDHHAICNGKHDDTKALNESALASAKGGGPISISDDCLDQNFPMEGVVMFTKTGRVP